MNKDDYYIITQVLIKQLKLKIIIQMNSVDLGKPLHIAAAEIGLMPNELERIYKQILEDNKNE